MGTHNFLEDSEGNGMIILEMNLWQTGCEDGSWIKLAKDHVQWQAFVLAVLNIQVLVQELYSYIIIK
jgi:hypothetical protein